MDLGSPLIQCVHACVPAQSFSHVWPFVTPWAVGHQTPLSTEFSKQEYWSGFPFPPPGDPPDPRIKPASPASAEGFFTAEPSGKPSPVWPHGNSITSAKTLFSLRSHVQETGLRFKHIFLGTQATQYSRLALPVEPAPEGRVLVFCSPLSSWWLE